MSKANDVEKVVIIGSTAAIYAARANLNPLVFEGAVSSASEMIPGGQLMFTTEVENYPGFPEGIAGPTMMDAFRKQALRFEVRLKPENVEKIDLSSRPFQMTGSEDSEVRAHAVIVATGASANWQIG